MSDEAKRIEHGDRVAALAVDAEERATALAWEMMDERRERVALLLRDEPERVAWVEVLGDDVRDYAVNIARNAIRGDTTRDDDAREALADWLREEAGRIVDAWLTKRGVFT